MSKTPVTIERPDLFAPIDPRTRVERAPLAVPAPVKALTLCGGTTHWEWALPGSPFRTLVLEPAGIQVAARVEYWSGDVSGLPKWLNPWARDPLSDWRIGGEFLADTLSFLTYEYRNVLCH